MIFFIAFILISLFLLSSCSVVNKQKNESQKVGAFTMQFEKHEKGILLVCSEGCSWTELNFSKKNYQSQQISEYGMTGINNTEPEEYYKNLADFLFTITKTNNGLELKGLKGTKWKSLTFNLANNVPQKIDHNGMK